MDIEAIEDCLQRAAEQSTVWALVREQDADAWMVVLEDESLLDVEFDADSGRLMMRTELGQILQANTRADFNDLLVRCASAFEIPRIGMSMDYRYELFAAWAFDPHRSDELAQVFNDVTTQARAWREIVAKPINLENPHDTERSPLGVTALKA